MDEYISKQKVIDYLNGYLHSLGEAGADNLMFDQGQRRALINSIQDISVVKSADVQRIKHGKWEELTDYGGWGDTHYCCSVCGEEWHLEDGTPQQNHMNFCPQCGARMDLKEGEKNENH